jgi:class 3 adenylate cyclase
VDSRRLERRLTAILSADAVGYSRLMSEDEEGTARTGATFRQLISDLVGQGGGRVVDAPGDNVLAEFPSVVDGVRCAVGIQEELGRRNAELPEGRRLLFRIGVNLGDVLVEGDRIVGDGVNVAARLEALAEPGGICVSGNVRDQVRGRLDAQLEDLGRQTFKNIPEPVRCYRVRPGLEPGADAVPGEASALRSSARGSCWRSRRASPPPGRGRWAG